MKIYTKTGDAGKTSLIGNTKVDKDDTRVEAYGNIDELNSHIGLLISTAGITDEIGDFLHHVQGNLFLLSSLMASEKYNEKYEIDATEIEKVEEEIDRLTAMLPKKFSFVYPGGNLASSESHICRTVCRRAERRVVTMSRTMNAGMNTLPYLNRISDYFFTLARYINYRDNVDEKKWEISCK